MSDQARHRIFPKEPTNDFVDSVCKYIAETGEPETMESLFHNKISKTEPITILREITINRKKRPNGDWAPCPMCGHSKKFLNGYLCWFSERHFVAVIGHDCASQEALDEAKRNYKNKKQKKAEEDYLDLTLRHVPAMLSAFKKIRPVAIEAQRLYRKFHKEAALIQKHLWQATKSNDRLVVFVEISEQLKAVGASGSSGQQGHIETTDVTFGRLSGLTAVRPTFDPVKALNKMEAEISAYNIGEDEEKILYFICALNEKDRKFCVGKLQEISKSFQKLYEKLKDFGSFFDTDNLHRLNAWGRHPENPTPIYVEDGKFQNQRKITIKYKQLETVMSPKADLWDLDINWPIK